MVASGFARRLILISFMFFANNDMINVKTTPKFWLLKHALDLDARLVQLEF